MAERILSAADMMINEKCTVRDIAKKTSYSKSTVHLDLSKRLYRLDPKRAEEVKKILNINLEERTVRGGEATKRKFLEATDESN
jgi:putative DeoR family transcriptional regulator (stage III sporulation protein D)